MVMQVCTDNASLLSALVAVHEKQQRIAFVPTMGNLHAGHLDVMAKAQSVADCVVASIYVNPTQFGPTEDFGAYPRTLADDIQKLEQQGVAILYAPSQADIYPDGLESIHPVAAGELGTVLCGRSRPGHFDGVATVVLRLFELVQPDVALFGRKDYQQLRVIQSVVAAVGCKVEIMGVETVREPDGLAMSSRNQYLSVSERAQAPALYAILTQAGHDWARGLASCEVESRGKQQLDKAGFKTDYFQICQLQNLLPSTIEDKKAIILVAAVLGRARLIDNLVVSR